MSLTEEVAEFLGRGCTPEEVLAFHPSEEASERVGDLIARSKSDAGLTAEERAELDRALHLEHLVRLAKKSAVAALEAERAVAA
ncbi:hypothetical protein [Alienimonas sp. DA493]|uniref:hypothetical protein n=1 Tax=Alienimonas sp. DA493 TaxID=3373605 RepID=UPI0037549918